MNSHFDWYISITNLFTELMIDWRERDWALDSCQRKFLPILKENEAQIFQNHSLIWHLNASYTEKYVIACLILIWFYDFLRRQLIEYLYFLVTTNTQIHVRTAEWLACTKSNYIYFFFLPESRGKKAPINLFNTPVHKAPWPEYKANTRQFTTADDYN